MKLTIANVELRTPQEVLDICNAKLEEWLKNAPTVYGIGSTSGRIAVLWSISNSDADDTHAAKLVCIEEMK